MKGRTLALCALLFCGASAAGYLLRLPVAVPVILLSISIAILLTNRTPHLLSLAVAFAGIAAAGALGGCLQSRYPSIHPLDHPRLDGVRTAAAQRLHTALGDTRAAGMATAVTLGDRSGIDRATLRNFKASGAMHLLALSGLHVGVLYFILCRALFFLSVSPPLRRLRGTLVSAVLVAYAAVTGMSPSISRAVLMLCFYELSDSVAGERCALAALSVAAILITALDPSAPSQLGFQLSFCSVLSIIFIYPHLRAMLSTRSRLLGKVWSLLSVSIACQLGTFPITWLTFGTFPTFFMVTNLVAIPLVTVGMYLSIPLFILNPGGRASAVIVAILNKIVLVLYKIIEILADLC